MPNLISDIDGVLKIYDDGTVDIVSGGTLSIDGTTVFDAASDATLNDVSVNTLNFGDASPTLSDNGNYLRIQTTDGYMDIGANNATYAHFYTDRPSFYFNVGSYHNGAIASYQQDLNLNRSNSSTARLRITAGTTVSDQDFSVTGDVTISGDLTVSGSTTTLNTSTITAEDAVIVLNSGQATPSNDIGLVFQRYSSPTASNYNATIVWEETDDRFILGTTAETGADSNITLASEMATINSSGIGVGTASPSAKLHTYGTGWASNTVGSNLLRVEASGNTGAAIAMKNANGEYWNVYNGGSSSWVGQGNLGFVYSNGSVDPGGPLMTLTKTGRIGLGVTNPTYQVQITKADTSRSGALFVSAQLNSSGKGLVIDTTTRTTNDNAVAAFEIINRAGSTAVITTVEGKVGIGTNAPQSPLQVASNSTSVAPLVLQGPATNGMVLIGHNYLGSNEYYNTQGMDYSTNSWMIGSGVYVDSATSRKQLSTQDNYTTRGASMYIDGANGAIDFYTSNVSSTRTKGAENTDITHRLRISADGGVGIGTTDPVGKLQVGSHTFAGGQGVYSDDRVGIANHGSLTSIMYASTYNNATYPDYGLVFVHGPSTSSYNVWSISPDGPAKGDSLNFIYGANSANIHTVTPKVVFDGNGHVGVGTASPTVQFEVYDSTTWDTAHFSSNTATGAGISLDATNTGVRWSVIAQGTSGGADDNNLGFHLTSAGTSGQSTGYKAVLTSSGGVKFGNGTFESIGNSKMQIAGGRVDITTSDTDNGAYRFYQSTTFRGGFGTTNWTGAANSGNNGVGVYATGGDFTVHHNNGTPSFRFSDQGHFGLETSDASDNVTNGYPKIVYPNVHWSGNGTTTGCILIRTPGDLSNYDMCTIELTVYEYNSMNASTIIIGGHNWTSGGMSGSTNAGWHNYGIKVIGTFNKPIYLAQSTTDRYIVLGDNTSSWTYGVVGVVRVQGATFYPTNMDWTSDWDINQSTSASFQWQSADLNSVSTTTLSTPGSFHFATNAGSGFRIGRSNDNNMFITAATTGAAGVSLRDSSGTFRSQWYGEGSSYGFLDSDWGSWDIKKVTNGGMYLNGDNTYFLRPEGTSVFSKLGIGTATASGATKLHVYSTDNSTNITVSSNSVGGPILYLHSTNTGGKQLGIISNNSSNADGAGLLQFWNATDGHTFATWGTTSGSLSRVYTNLAVAGDTTNSTFSGPGQVALKRSNGNPYLSFHDNAGTRSGYIQSVHGDDLLGFYDFGTYRFQSLAANTTVQIQPTDAGLALLQVGKSTSGTQGTGAVEVTQDGLHGGGISYNGDGSPAFVSGETADHIAFYRNDNGSRTEVFKYPYNSNNVTFNGRVGVYTDPSYPLHVQGPAADGKIVIETGNSNSYDSVLEFKAYGNGITTEGAQIWYDNSVGDVHFQTTYANDAAAIRFHTRTATDKVSTGTNERLTINGNGNVGIGYTNPTYKLAVNGTAYVATNLTVNDSAQFEGSTNPIRIGDGFGSGGSATIHKYNADLYLQYNNGQSATNLRFGGGGTSVTLIDSQNESWRIGTAGGNSWFNDDGGNVGIGVSLPQKTLDVVSPNNGHVTVGARTMGVGSYTGIHFGYRENNSSYRKSAIVFERTDNAPGGGGNAAGKIHILNGPETGSGSAAYPADAKVTIDEVGNVGIGITNPSAKLEVVGTAGSLFSVTDSLTGTIFSVGDASGIPSIEVDDTGVVRFAEFQGNVLIGTATDDSQNKLQVDGGIMATADITAYASSDERLKTNLETIDNALEKVDSLTGYTFNWNERARGKDPEAREAGIIAQDVEKVLPEVVTTRDDGYMAVKYEKLVPLLIEAIKDLKAEIEELKRK